MAGVQRYWLYRLAVETGLRSGELRSLTRVSFDLNGSDPTVTIAAASAKNRDFEDPFPMNPPRPIADKQM